MARARLSFDRGPLPQFNCEEELWMDDAACRDKPTSWFFPGPGESKRKALETCETCPVLVECGEYARRTKTLYGIWGGRILRRSEPYLDDTEVVAISDTIIYTTIDPDEQ